MGVDAGATIAFGYDLSSLECPWDEYFEENDCEFENWYLFEHLGLKEPEYVEWEQYKAALNSLREKNPIPFEIEPVSSLSDQGYWAIIPGSNDPDSWEPLPPITPAAIENLKMGLNGFGVKVEGEPKWLFEAYFC